MRTEEEFDLISQGNRRRANGTSKGNRTLSRFRKGRREACRSALLEVRGDPEGQPGGILNSVEEDGFPVAWCTTTAIRQALAEGSLQHPVTWTSPEASPRTRQVRQLPQALLSQIFVSCV